MPSNEAESTTSATDEGGQRGPLRITVPPLPPAAVDARDKLLAAISNEAQRVAGQFAGQASGPLAELARAYDLVVTGSPRRLYDLWWADGLPKEPGSEDLRPYVFPRD
ncbi:hypothetical protein ACFU8Q_10985 [Streptomyces sp. NPDC057543]|uniref:hypothetical protein n=1 Tax=Streptomyces sp. NPDC057543 TaxID=3346163 RepID=UPI0036A1F29C